MAITQNTYSGDGSTTNYSFTFEYLNQSDVKATLDGTATTAFTFANATTLSFTTAPANGVAIRIFRDTDIDALKATFFPGSAIKAEDLNSNFNQSNFAVQEFDIDLQTANTNASTALTTANSATNTANQAATDAATAITTANNAVTTANGAVTTANSTIATANTATTTANNAVTIANAATATANAASNAVASALPYQPVSNISSLPSSPNDLDRYEVVDSTGINAIVSGIPAGIVGDPGLTFRIEYSASAGSWQFNQYFPSDPDNRYQTETSFIETPQTLTTDKDIASNINAALMGPTVSIGPSVTISIGSNSLLSVIY